MDAASLAGVTRSSARTSFRPAVWSGSKQRDLGGIGLLIGFCPVPGRLSFVSGLALVLSLLRVLEICGECEIHRRFAPSGRRPRPALFYPRRPSKIFKNDPVRSSASQSSPVSSHSIITGPGPASSC